MGGHVSRQPRERRQALQWPHPQGQRRPARHSCRGGPGRTRKGNGALRATLVEAAQAARRKKDTYLAAPFRRVAARRGTKKAAVAVGHSILVIVYHLLRDGTIYQDLGSTYFDRRGQAALERRLVKRLEALGHTVTLAPAA
jgi:transposase